MKRLSLIGLIILSACLPIFSRAALSPSEKIELLEERFLEGKVSERTYLELRTKYRGWVEAAVSPPPLPTPPGRDKARVIHIMDGDTVSLSNGERVRYLGIDTPESRKKNADGSWKKLTNPYADRATELNRRLVKGKRIELEYDVTARDRYGRKLCYVFIDGVFVNAELVRRGLAMPMSCPPDVKYEDILRMAMDEARLEKRGLWKDLRKDPIAAAEAEKYIGQVQTVEGEVKSVYPGEQCISLNFGDDFRTDFTIAIFPNQLDNFRRRNIDPVRDYLGKRVRVCGLIKEYNGPEIVAERPEEIEFVPEEEILPQPMASATPPLI